jgi:hypothetical protein
MSLQGVRLDPDCGDVLETLRTIDISRCGLGAYSRNSFYPGQRVVLCLPLSDDGGKRNIYATVVRFDRSNGRYRVGLEFDSSSVGCWCGIRTAAVAAA